MLVSKLFVEARSRHALIIFVPGYPVSRSMFEFERSHNARDEDGWEYQSTLNRKENVRPEDLIQQIPNVTDQHNVAMTVTFPHVGSGGVSTMNVCRSDDGVTF